MDIKNKGLKINEHFRENAGLYIISLICIVIGIIVGIYAVKYMGSFQKTDLKSYLDNFRTSILANKIEYRSVFFEALRNNFIVIAAIWFLGLMIIGIPIILLIDFIKGFTFGFAISFLINEFGVKGSLMCLLGIIPQNIIYFPCLIIASVIAMEFSLVLIKDNNKWIRSIWVRIASYTLRFVVIIAVMFLGFIIEAYISPNLVKLVASNIWSVYA